MWFPIFRDFLNIPQIFWSVPRGIPRTSLAHLVHKLAPEPWHLRGPYPGQGGGSRKRARQTLGTCISFDKCCRCRRRLCLIMQRSQLCVFPAFHFPGSLLVACIRRGCQKLASTSVMPPRDGYIFLLHTRAWI